MITLGVNFHDKLDRCESVIVLADKCVLIFISASIILMGSDHHFSDLQTLLQIANSCVATRSLNCDLFVRR